MHRERGSHSDARAKKPLCKPSNRYAPAQIRRQRPERSGTGTSRIPPLSRHHPAGPHIGLRRREPLVMRPRRTRMTLLDPSVAARPLQHEAERRPMDRRGKTLKTDTSASSSAVSPTRPRNGGILNDRHYSKKGSSIHREQRGR